MWILHTLSLYFTHSFSVFYTHSLCILHTLSLYFTHSFSVFYTHSLCILHTLSLYFTHSLCILHTLSLYFTHSLSVFYTHSLYFYTPVPVPALVSHSAGGSHPPDCAVFSEVPRSPESIALPPAIVSSKIYHKAPSLGHEKFYNPQIYIFPFTLK